MKTLPKIELKNVNINDHMSEETPCYSATVYLDGKRFCIASNRGHGGCDEYEAIRPKSGWKLPGDYREANEAVHDKIAEINEYLRKHHGSETFTRPDGSTFTVEKNNFDYLVYDELDRWEAAKTLKAAMRRKWSYTKPQEPGALFEANRSKGQKPEIMAEVLEKQVPGAKLLNAIPEAEALEIWKDWIAA